jgi:hypothetical protein
LEDELAKYYIKGSSTKYQLSKSFHPTLMDNDLHALCIGHDTKKG